VKSANNRFLWSRFCAGVLEVGRVCGMAMARQGPAHWRSRLGDWDQA